MCRHSTKRVASSDLMMSDVAMEISGVVACDCRLGGRGGGGHVAGPELGRQFYLWSCKEVDVFYSVGGTGIM